MSESVHGHEVMHFMLEKGGSFTRESLKDALIDHFGPNTRFHTCSAKNMTAEQLIEFLAAKGKFVEDGNGSFNTETEMICSH